MSSNQMITDINSVNIETAFKYQPVKINGAGGKSVGIQNKNLGKKVVIKTPLMLTWGLSDYEGNEKYSISSSPIDDVMGL